MNPFDADIARFEAHDRAHPPPLGATVFAGSSTIRLWRTLKRDFPERPIIQRGFGGSEYSDLVEFARRIITPYRPRAVVMYSGENDVGAHRRPADIAVQVDMLLRIIRMDCGPIPVHVISIKPSPARLAVFDRIRETNARLAERATPGSGVHFENVFDAMLDEAGQPRMEYFMADGLHLSSAGYARWRELLGPRLVG